MPSAQSRLDGKRAIVTGAASGIGRATAVLFASEGAAVVCADVNQTGVEETAEQIEKAGGRARAVKASAGEEADTHGLIDRCLRDFGGLEIFYANAGVSGGMTTLFDTEVSDWREVLEINVIGQLNPLRRAGAPREIAAAALFLASDDSSYVNGQAYAVDGGLSSSLPTAPGKFF